ncbi:hypothetical protein UK12_25200 [Saccharothrix sp. ST-888]|nr:hypothetical protein UK12_25200 [Saccharothrix sp. ST-888]
MSSRGAAGKPRLLAADWGSDSLAVLDLGAPERPEAQLTAVPGTPRAVAVGTDGTRAYTVDPGAGTLSVLDLAADEPAVLRTVPAGTGPCAVVAGLVDDRVCVADWAGGQVLLFDREGQQPVVLEVGAGPGALAAAPAGRARRVCVVNESDATVSVVDLGRPGPPAVTAIVPVAGLTRAVAVAPDGRFGYVVGRGDGTAGCVTVLDLDGGVPVGDPVAVGAEPRAIAVSPAGDRLCVANYGSASVSIAALHPETGRIGTPVTVATGPHPLAVAFAPDGGLIHVLSQTTGTLTAIDPDTLDRTDLPVGTLPCGVVFGPDGRYAYVTDQAAGELVTVRAAPYRAGAIETGAGSRPAHAAVSPDGRWGYAADTAAERLAVLDLDHPGPGSPIELGPGRRPWDVAIAPDLGFACATSPDSDELLVLRPAPGQVLEGGGEVRVGAVALAPGARPHGLAVTPDSRYAVTADSATATVSIVDPRGGVHTIGQEVVQCQKPVGAALSRDGRTLYVADFGTAEEGQPGGQIVVLRRTGPAQWVRQGAIDAQTGRLSGPHEMALRLPDEQRLYVANYQNGTVSVLDCDAGRWTCHAVVAKSPRAMKQPYGLALSQDGGTLYVSNAAEDTGTVEEFDVAAEPAAHRRTITVRRNQSAVHAGLALSPDGQFLYAVDPESWAGETAWGTVYGMRLAAGGAELQAVPVPPAAGTARPGGLVCRDDRTLCVVNQGSTSATAPRDACLAVLTLDESRLGVQAAETLPLETAAVPYSAAVSGEGTLCIANLGGTVTVLGSEVTAVPVGEPGHSRPWDVAVTADGVYAYATDRAAGSVRCVRLDDHAVTSVEVGEDPMGVASGPSGVSAYVANHGDHSISVLGRVPERTATPTRVTSTGSPLAVAVHPRTPCAYLVRDTGLDAVPLDADLGPERSGPGPSLGTALCAVAVHPAGTHAYAVDAGGPVPAVHAVDLSAADRPADGGAAAALTGGARPTGIALHPRQPWGYVGGSGDGGAGALWVLGTGQADRPSVTGTGELPLPAVEGLAIRPGPPDRPETAGHLYLLTRSGDSCRLRVLELTDDPTRPEPLPGPGLELPAGTRSIAVHPRGGYAFLGGDDGTVRVLDLADPARPRLVGGTPGLGARPGLAFRPDGRSALYLTADGFGELTLGAPAVVATWRDPRLIAPQWPAVSADGARLFVTCENSGALVVLDTRTGTARFTVPAGTALAGAAPHPTQHLLYVADEAGAAVAVVDTTELAHLGGTPLGLDPQQVVRVPGAS